MDNYKTLARLEMEEITERLIIFEYNRTKTAKSLGISYKNLLNKIKEIKNNHPDLYETMGKAVQIPGEPIAEDDYSHCTWYGMPTNEFRIKYMNQNYKFRE